MKNKSNIRKLFLSALLLICMYAFTACGEDDKKGSGEMADNSTSTNDSLFGNIVNDAGSMADDTVDDITDGVSDIVDDLTDNNSSNTTRKGRR